MPDTDPYAQQRAIAAANAESQQRFERQQMMAKLEELLKKVDELAALIEPKLKTPKKG